MFRFGVAETYDSDLVAILKSEYSSMVSVEPVEAFSRSSEPIAPEDVSPDAPHNTHFGPSPPASVLPSSSEPIAPKDVSSFVEESEQDDEALSEEADIGIVEYPNPVPVVMPDSKSIAKARKSRSLRKVVGYLVESVLPHLNAEELSRERKIDSLYAMLLVVRREDKIAILDKPKKKLLKVIETFVPKEK